VWSDAFGTSEIPSFTIFDAQMNYEIRSLRSVIKAGANNIGGQEYFAGLGTGFIGSQFYIGVQINNL